MNGDSKKNIDYSIIPGVDRVLNEQAIQTLAKRCGISVLTDMIRQAIDRVRGMMRDGESVGKSREALIKWIVGDVERELAEQFAPNLRRVVNATGVILHTNLGRAPLSDVAVKHIADIAGSYSNLELDLETGQRGSRTTLVEKLLCELTGAEAAAIANNNAAAVLLTLNTLAGGKEAIVSRGQLVEIGGVVPDSRYYVAQWGATRRGGDDQSHSFERLRKRFDGKYGGDAGGASEQLQGDGIYSRSCTGRYGGVGTTTRRACGARFGRRCAGQFARLRIAL